MFKGDSFIVMSSAGMMTYTDTTLELVKEQIEDNNEVGFSDPHGKIMIYKITPVSHTVDHETGTLTGFTWSDL